MKIGKYKLVYGSSGLRNATLIVLGAICLSPSLSKCDEKPNDGYGTWMANHESEWPQITMINHIEYSDANHPVAGCGFLLELDNEVVAATAKHILVYFKSDSMQAVSFENTLRRWEMYPKNNANDVVVLDELINEDPRESLTHVPCDEDWLLFTVKDMSENIQPLRFRTNPIREGERVYIIGWRYTDKYCPQVVYAGNYVRSEEGSVLITTDSLADNTMPGLSGSPVIDSRGYLIGLMSQKAGKMERLSSIDYPRKIIVK